MNASKVNVIAGCVCLFASTVAAAEHRVANDAQLSFALSRYIPGDEIVILPGEYRGRYLESGLRNVTLRSADPVNPAVFTATSPDMAVFHIRGAKNLVLRDIVIDGRGIGGNGLSIDDGGSLGDDRHITVENVNVINLRQRGNVDGIKLTRLEDVIVRGCGVRTWGLGGQAIDVLGCHRVRIESNFVHNGETERCGGGIVCKGGCRDIEIYANRVEFYHGENHPDNDVTNGRCIQAGGATGKRYFWFVDGESGYEAKNVMIVGNVCIGGNGTLSVRDAVDTIIAHNLARLGWWGQRMGSESDVYPIGAINTRIMGNVYWYDRSWASAMIFEGLGKQTVLEGNQYWDDLNVNKAFLPPLDEENRTIRLPTIEPDGPIAWRLKSGHIWIVNATGRALAFKAPQLNGRLATPGKTGIFKPLLDPPFVGEWSYAELPEELGMLPMSQIYISID